MKTKQVTQEMFDTFHNKIKLFYKDTFKLNYFIRYNLNYEETSIIFYLKDLKDVLGIGYKGVVKASNQMATLGLVDEIDTDKNPLEL